MIVVKTTKPIAIDSPDHTHPNGTSRDNSRNPAFNAKLYQLVPPEKLRVLDIGCSGGAFVKSIIDDGGLAVGIEGSDYSQKINRAEWATIPGNLFTADATVPFEVREHGLGQIEHLKFDVVTAWEVWEHFKEEDIPAVCENIRKHLDPSVSSFFIGTIYNGPDIQNGRVTEVHQCIHPIEWWEAKFDSLGFERCRDLEAWFDRDLVRLEGTPIALRIKEQPQPPKDYSKCVVLVPFRDHIGYETEECLDAVEKLGIQVARLPGQSAIEFSRCEMASTALNQGYESILFIDSDMIFNPPDVAYIFDRPEPVVAGLYSQKRYKYMNAILDDSVDDIKIGLGGEDYPAMCVGAGFLRIKADVLRTLIDVHSLPLCTSHGGALWPFFQSFNVCDNGVWSYLGEDYAFCRRCTDAGIPVIVDGRIRLYHVGPFLWGLEHAGTEKPGYAAALTLRHGKQEPKPLSETVLAEVLTKESASC